VFVLFSVVLAVVVLPGTGLMRKVRGWFSRGNEKARGLEVKSLLTNSKSNLNYKKKTEYDNV
jgi:hypothetical protein